MKIILISILVSVIILDAETLFEVKDSLDQKVFDISDDGLRVYNLGDTLMVISATGIKAIIGENKNKGLSRSFSVTTTSSVKGSDNDLMRLTADSTRFWISDTGSGFGVSTLNSARKGIQTNVFEVDTRSTSMREDSLGSQYTSFSPENIFLGLNAGVSSVNSFGNIFIGNNSGASNESGGSNVFLGDQAGFKNISGYNNVFIGLEAGYSSIDNNANTYVGYRAGTSTTGFGNTYVGHTSGYFSTTGSQNSYYGIYSGTYSNGGNNNCYFGYNAASNNKDGSSNCAFGHYAGFGIEPTSTNYSDNCLYGDNTGQQLKTGSRNVMIGKDSGFKTSFGNNNVLMGYMSGYNMTTGSNNLFLGAFSGYSNATGTNNIFLGDSSGYSETASNKLYIANSNTTTPLIKGTFPNTDITLTANQVSVVHPSGYTSNGLIIQSTYSGNTDKWRLYQNDADHLQLYYNSTLRGAFSYITGVYTPYSKDGKNAEDLGQVVDKVMKLQPKRYELSGAEGKGNKFIGLNAKEVIDVFPEFVYYIEDEDAYTVDYAGLSVIALQAIKELKNENTELKNKIIELESLKAEIEKIKEQISLK